LVGWGISDTIVLYLGKAKEYYGSIPFKSLAQCIHNGILPLMIKILTNKASMMMVDTDLVISFTPQ
jgi:hypothetical protein